MFSIDKSSEDTNHLELKLIYNKENGSEFQKIIKDLECQYIKKIECYFYFHEKTNGAINWHEFNEEFRTFKENALCNNIDENKNDFYIKIFLTKENDETFPILFEEEFLSQIPSESNKKINYWNKIFKKYRFLYLARSKQKVSIEISGAVQLEGIYDNKGIFNSQIEYKPEDCWNILKEIKTDTRLYEHISYLILNYCLALLANDVKIEEIEYKEKTKTIKKRREIFVFEGFGRSEINLNIRSENLHEILDIIFTSYQWSFSDHQISTKLGILRNVVSINSEKNLEKIFTRSFLKILFSNYQVYLQDNIHKYIEVKNKAIEIINNLNDKIVENYYSFRKTARASTYAVLTFYFTFVVTKIISSEESQIRAIDFEVFFITLIFCVTASIFITLQFSEITQFYDFSKRRVSKIKDQYEGTLSDKERDEVFSDSLLLTHDEIDLSYDELNIYYGILAFLTIGTFVLALVNFLNS